MNRILVFLVSFLTAFGSAHSTIADGSPVVLTVYGSITESNRGPVDPVVDRLLFANGVAFEQGYSIRLDQLSELDQATATARASSWDQARSLSGPKLSSLLDLVGADPTATLVLSALDGYAAELTASDRSEELWIVATHEDGSPLGVGGAGPLWVLPDKGTSSVPQGAASNWVWALYLIEVR